jgi:hypothetical protein
MNVQHIKLFSTEKPETKVKNRKPEPLEFASSIILIYPLPFLE